MLRKGPVLGVGRKALLLASLLILGLVGTRGNLSDEDLEGEEAGEPATVVAGRGDDEFEVMYDSPVPIGDFHFAEHFDDVDQARRKWVMSKAEKEEQNNMLKYEGKWDFEFPMQRLFPTDKGLVLKSKAKLHAISAPLERPFEFRDKPLIVQYEVNFQNGIDCGGAYVKLLTSTKDLNLNVFNDKTPYTIMFGPDKCGSDMKVHFIFRHKNPLNGSFSEKHSKRPSNRVEETYTDKKPHLYRLKLTPDNRFEVFVDDRLINSGSLLEDMEPKVNPPMEIEDPNQVKPADWDEREKIPDPTAAKPDDWDDEAPMKIPDPTATPPAGWLTDEPEMISDPTAVKPEDWDESMDGSWEAPLISNPNCVGAPGCGPWTAPLIDNPNFRGKWKAPMISNPNYKGKWVPPKIPNPDYFEDKEPFKMTPIGAVGLELWTMSDQILFDNFIISDDQAVIDDWTSKTWELKRRVLDKDNEGVFRRILNYTNAHPWLWAVYVILIALPVVLIFTFCCGSSQEKKPETMYKKSDDVSPDDDQEPQAAPTEEVSQSKKKSANRPKTVKDELEEEEEENAEDLNNTRQEELEVSAEEFPQEDSPLIAAPILKKRHKGRPRKD